MGIAFDSLPPHVKHLISGQAAEPKKLVPTMAERELHRDVANWLLRERIWHVDSRMDKRTSQRKGIPDFVCCADGKFLAIELKRPGEKLSEDQQREFDDILFARGAVCVAIRLEEVIRAISELGKGRKL